MSRLGENPLTPFPEKSILAAIEEMKTIADKVEDPGRSLIYKAIQFILDEIKYEGMGLETVIRIRPITQ